MPTIFLLILHLADMLTIQEAEEGRGRVGLDVPAGQGGRQVPGARQGEDRGQGDLHHEPDRVGGGGLQRGRAGTQDKEEVHYILPRRNINSIFGIEEKAISRIIVKTFYHNFFDIAFGFRTISLVVLSFHTLHCWI